MERPGTSIEMASGYGRLPTENDCLALTRSCGGTILRSLRPSILAKGKQGALGEISHAATGFLHVGREASEAIHSQLSLPTCDESFGNAMIPFFQPLVRQHPTRGPGSNPPRYATYTFRLQSSALLESEANRPC